jgi:hypothetical protein
MLMIVHLGLGRTWGCDEPGCSRATHATVLPVEGFREPPPLVVWGACWSTEITRVSQSLRRAVVEIDLAPTLEGPFDNGAGTTWQTVFELVGWDLTVEKGDSDIPEPSGEFWSDAEMHETMLKRRGWVDLDSEWRYHVLCVRRLRSADRGLMYDDKAIDSNDVPGEGIGFGTGWVASQPFWGPLVGRRFGEATSSYSRTALHEVGHAMELQHNVADFGVMNTTGVSTIHRALDCQQLTEHVAWIEAKRHAVPFFERPARLEQAVDLLDESTVMTQAEIARAAEIVKYARSRVATAPADAGLADAADAAAANSGEEAACDRLTAILKTKVMRQTVADSLRMEIAAL